MCLKPEFFEKREKLRFKYEAEGEIELNRFLDKLLPIIITESDLFKIGILQKKEYSDTGDLSDYEVSKLGSEYLNEREYQLVLVKPNKHQALLQKLLSSCW